MMPRGGTVCEFRLLSSRFAKGEEVTEAVTFFCFDDEAEKFCEATEKGQLISATGTQETSTYTDGGGTRKSYVKYRLTWYSKGARPRSAQQPNQQGRSPRGDRFGVERPAGASRPSHSMPDTRPVKGSQTRSNAHPGIASRQPACSDGSHETGHDGFDDVETLI